MNGVTPITKEDVQVLVDLIWEDVAAAFEDKPKIVVHGRSTSSRLGTALYKPTGVYKAKYGYETNYDCKIMIYWKTIVRWAGAKHYLDALEDTIRHELAHVLAFQQHGRAAIRRGGHGHYWKAAAGKLGAIPEENAALPDLISFYETR